MPQVFIYRTDVVDLSCCPDCGVWWLDLLCEHTCPRCVAEREEIIYLQWEIENEYSRSSFLVGNR